jgi:hypothetical protein
MKWLKPLGRVGGQVIDVVEALGGKERLQPRIVGD